MNKIKDDMSENSCSLPATGPQKSDTDAAGDGAHFERWLDSKLKMAYGSVLEEPIPQDIIDLLRKKLD